MLEIVPTVAFPPVTPPTCHVTEVLVVFDSVAANGCVEPAATVAEVGETLMLTGPGWGGGFDMLEPDPPPQPINNPSDMAATGAKRRYFGLI